MCEELEKYVKEKQMETAKATAINTAKALFENGATYEMVSKSIQELSEEELRDIYNAVKLTK